MIIGCLSPPWEQIKYERSRDRQTDRETDRTRRNQSFLTIAQGVMTHLVILLIRRWRHSPEVRYLQHPAAVDDTVAGLEVTVRLEVALVYVGHALCAGTQAVSCWGFGPHRHTTHRRGQYHDIHDDDDGDDDDATDDIEKAQSKLVLLLVFLSFLLLLLFLFLFFYNLLTAPRTNTTHWRSNRARQNLWTRRLSYVERKDSWAI